MNNYKKDIPSAKRHELASKVKRSSPHRDDRESTGKLFREKSSSEITKRKYATDSGCPVREEEGEELGKTSNATRSEGFIPYAMDTTESF